MVDLCDKVSESEVVNNSSSQPTTPERVSSDGCTHPKTCADCGTTKTPLWRGGPAGPKSLCNACGIRSRKRRRAMLGLSNKEDKKAKKSTTSSSKSSNNGQQNQQQNNDNNNAASSSSNNSSSSGDNSSNSNSNSKSKSKSRLVDISTKRKLLTFGRDVALQRPRSSSTIQRRKLGEVEQAAFLLMALSCGSVYA